MSTYLDHLLESDSEFEAAATELFNRHEQEVESLLSAHVQHGEVDIEIDRIIRSEGVTLPVSEKSAKLYHRRFVEAVHAEQRTQSLTQES